MAGLRGPQQLGVCALDAAEVASAALAAAAPRSGGGTVEVVARAVRALHQASLNVILVVDTPEDPLARQLRNHVDGHRLLLHVRGPSPEPERDARLEVLRVAEEYNCLFMSGVDYHGICYGPCVWKMPRRLRAWLDDGGWLLRISFSFNEQGECAVVLPSRVAARSSPAAPRPAAPPQAGGLAKARASSSKPKVSKGAMPKEPGLAPGEVAACVLEVQRGPVKEQLLCFRCDDAGSGLFPMGPSLALELLGITGTDFDEIEKDDAELRAALHAKGSWWRWDPFILLSVTSGHQAGLRAVGLGSNQKKRKRAALMALAATAALHARAVSDTAVDGPGSASAAAAASGGEEQSPPWFAGGDDGAQGDEEAAEDRSMGADRVALLVQLLRAAERALQHCQPPPEAG